MILGKVKAHELRTKSKGELLVQLKELKEELSTVFLCIQLMIGFYSSLSL
jgi:hypothetical protein